MRSNPVIAALADPYQLERLYQEDPDRFSVWLQAALSAHPKAQVLQFWRARLQYRPDATPTPSIQDPLGLLPVAGLALLAFLALRLPLAWGVSAEWLLPRFAPFAVICALVTLLALWQQPPRWVCQQTALGLAGTWLVLLMLPSAQQSDSVTMALLHAPLVLALGLLHVGTLGNWRDSEISTRFLRDASETAVLMVLVLLGGGVLTALTLALFGLIGLNIGEWYAVNITLLGVVASPLVAAWLFYRALGGRSRFAGLLVSVFIPLFLISVSAFLVAMALAGRNPYDNRDDLIVVNGLLVVVLAMTLVSVCGRDWGRRSHFADTVGLGLLLVTLVVDAVAVSAMGFRLLTQGLTPNRVVVVGANLIIGLHLSLLARAYVRYLLGGAGAALPRAATRLLPLYGVWGAVVLVALPPLFHFA